MAFLVQLNTTRASNTNRLEEVSVLGFSSQKEGQQQRSCFGVTEQKPGNET